MERYWFLLYIQRKIILIKKCFIDQKRTKSCKHLFTLYITDPKNPYRNLLAPVTRNCRILDLFLTICTTNPRGPCAEPPTSSRQIPIAPGPSCSSHPRRHRQQHRQLQPHICCSALGTHSSRHNPTAHPALSLLFPPDGWRTFQDPQPGEAPRRVPRAPSRGTGAVLLNQLPQRSVLSCDPSAGAAAA